MKINEEYMLASLTETPGKDRFEEIERLLLSNIAILDQSLPMVHLAEMQGTNHDIY